MKDKITSAFQKGDTQSVIRFLKKIKLDESDRKTVDNLENQYHQTEKDFQEGRIDYETKRLYIARVSHGLQGVFDEQKEEDFRSTFSMQKYFIPGAILLAFVITFFVVRKNNQPATPVHSGDTMTTTGDQSPIMKGDSNKVIFNNQKEPKETIDEK